MCGFIASHHSTALAVPVNQHAECPVKAFMVAGAHGSPCPSAQDQVCTCSKCYCKVITNAPICSQVCPVPLHSACVGWSPADTPQCIRGNHAFPLKS